MNRQTIMLHLSLIEGIGPIKIKQLLERAPRDLPLADLYTMLPSDLVELFGCTPTFAHSLVQGLAKREVLQQEVDLLEKHGISLVTLVDDNYPTLLKAIYAPPTVLYYQGVLGGDSQKTIAVVGARKANQYGQRVVRQIVPGLVADGWTIVSGGALGLDTMAHDAALAAGGATIAVLGSGLLRPYPMRNKSLFKQIVEHGGALVSAFPLRMEAIAGNFPARNRIISGLSKGCLVVQAAEKSGARITAQFALDQGREVFAVPGLIDDPLSGGCHALIQQGAKLTTSLPDILTEFGYQSASKDFMGPEDEIVVKRNAYASDSLEARIFELLTHSACSVDDLIGHTSLDLVTLNGKLFDLQIAGLITQNFAGQWELI